MPRWRKPCAQVTTVSYAPENTTRSTPLAQAILGGQRDALEPKAQSFPNTVPVTSQSLAAAGRARVAAEVAPATMPFGQPHCQTRVPCRRHPSVGGLFLAKIPSSLPREGILLHPEKSRLLLLLLLGIARPNLETSG